MKPTLAKSLNGMLTLMTLLSGCGAPNRGEPFRSAMANARRSYHNGQFGEAADHFQRAATSAQVPRDTVFARYEAALARARSGDVAHAALELRAIASEKPTSAYAAQAAFKAAELARLNDETSGLHELEGVVVRFPSSGVAGVALGHLLRHDDTLGEAVALARLDALRPQVRGSELEERVAYERARRLDALNDAPAARTAYLAVASQWPYPFGAFNDDALFRAAGLEETLGRPVEAVSLLERLLAQREVSSFLGSYERPRYLQAILRIAQIYERTLHDRWRAKAALQRLSSQFTTSTSRDDALWQEAKLWFEEAEATTACARLATLAHDFPDSRYVPCLADRCPAVLRPPHSKAPTKCRAYLSRDVVSSEP